MVTGPKTKCYYNCSPIYKTLFLISGKRVLLINKLFQFSGSIKLIYMQLKQIIEKTDTKLGKTFDLTIQSLIVLSLISFSISTIPDLGDTISGILYIFEIITVSIFTIEYVLRIMVADKN